MKKLPGLDHKCKHQTKRIQKVHQTVPWTAPKRHPFSRRDEVSSEDPKAAFAAEMNSLEVISTDMSFQSLGGLWTKFFVFPFVVGFLVLFSVNVYESTIWVFSNLFNKVFIYMRSCFGCGFPTTFVALLWQLGGSVFSPWPKEATTGWSAGGSRILIAFWKKWGHGHGFEYRLII